LQRALQSTSEDALGRLRYGIRVLGFGFLLIYLNVYWIVAPEHHVVGAVTISNIFQMTCRSPPILPIAP